MSPFSTSHLRWAEHRFALTVIAVFLSGGLAWIFLTDFILYTVTRDPIQVARIETAKGWLFVLLAAVFLYPVLRRSVLRLTRLHATLSAVIDSIGDGVLLLGPGRTILHANPAALRTLRCEKLDDLIGMDADQFSRRFRLSFPNGALVPPGEFISQRVFTEGGPLRHTVILHPPGGEEAIFAATAAAVRMTVGASPEIVVSVWHDITDTERLEELRNQFFTAAAHSFKTPLAIINASAQMALSGDLAPGAARSVATIERQSRRIDRLVDNLLVLARARSGTLQLHPTEVELGPLVEDVAREMTRTSGGREVFAEILASARAHADPERLAIVLRNLIDGACRRSEDSTPITVRLTRRGRDAEIGVRHEPRPEWEASDAYLEYDDMGVNRYVNATVVKAHGGASREETAGPERTDWIRLPAIEGPDGTV
jgi:signal transduction histidine kinase